MRSHRPYRSLTLAGAAAGLSGLAAVTFIVVTEPVSTARPPATSAFRTPVATAVGDGGGAAVYPGVVSVHFDRSRAGVAGASIAMDLARPGFAIRNVQAAETQMAASWVATRYLIQTTPVPPPAGADGAAPGGSGYADPPTTAMGLFTLQHDVASAAAGMLSRRPRVNAQLVKTLQVTATTRDQAVAFIHQFEPTPPPAPDGAGADGAVVGGNFAAIMPTVLPLIDDEISALRGVLSINARTLPADVAAAARAIIAKDTATQQTINTYWPPLPADD